MSKMNKLCSNVDQSNPNNGGFTDEEKARMRKNIGVTNYNRITNNIVLAMTHDTTTESISQISLDDFIFYNEHEYHTFVTIPMNTIQLANYNKDKVILAIWIGANNWASAPFKMRLRCNVENGIVKNSSSIIPIDWLGENLTTDVLDYIHMSFHDDDNDNLIALTTGQSLSFVFRGTESYVQ